VRVRIRVESDLQSIKNCIDARSWFKIDSSIKWITSPLWRWVEDGIVESSKDPSKFVILDGMSYWNEKIEGIHSGGLASNKIKCKVIYFVFYFSFWTTYGTFYFLKYFSNKILCLFVWYTMAVWWLREKTINTKINIVFS